MFTFSSELQAEIRRYGARVAYEIKSLRKRENVAREYAEHLEDAIYYRMLHDGMEEMEAFHDACAELGNVTKMQELLALTHNKDPLPTGVTFMLWLLGVVLVGSSYFWIDDYFYRSCLLAALDWCILGVLVFLLLQAGLYIRALRIRRKSYRQLKVYAEQNGINFIRHASSYRSIFTRTTEPEWILETEKERYILSLFATVKRRRELQLSDIQLYQYTKVSGFPMMFGRTWSTFPVISSGCFDTIFRIRTISIHTFGTGARPFDQTVRLPKGFHLLPDIDWKSAEHPTKTNIRVLLLNPIPMKVSALENGHIRKSGDADTVGDYRVWSASGLISYLEGVRISGKHDYTRTQE